MLAQWSSGDTGGICIVSVFVSFVLSSAHVAMPLSLPCLITVVQNGGCVTSDDSSLNLAPTN